jgi:xanthine dehydrogenase accessory factor
MATVVRAEAPTSAKAGAKAIITADGVLDGWVGGSCTQPTVVREALRAIQDGQPRFLRMCPPERMQGPQPGITEVVLACISGGTLEIYLEPHLPKPHILAIGHLPVVEALAALAHSMGYDVTVVGENASAEQFPTANHVQTFAMENPAAGLKLDAQTYVVVASHGNYDEPALEVALKSDAAYVALVASKKRRDVVLEYLHGSDVPPEKLARLKSPAGLDFGAVTPEEIALSILAEIVQQRRRPVENSKSQVPNLNPPSAISQAPTSLPPSIMEMRPREIPTPGPGEALDPVCFMLVEIATARYKSEYNGQTYYFCAPGCKRSFEKNPAQFTLTNNH